MTTIIIVNINRYELKITNFLTYEWKRIELICFILIHFYIRFATSNDRNYTLNVFMVDVAINEIFMHIRCIMYVWQDYCNMDSFNVLIKKKK